MKKLSIFSVFALVLLMSSRAFAGKPEAPRPAAPEPAKASFLLSLEVAPEAPALPDFLTGQPAPSPRTCQGNCFCRLQRLQGALRRGRHRLLWQLF